MRASRSSPTLLSLLTILLASAHLIAAKPYPRAEEAFPVSIGNETIVDKRCANPCGWSGQLCCASDQTCYTDSAGEAQCGTGATTSAPATASGWQYYTTTWVETDLETKTSTYSTYLGGATQQATTTSCTSQPSTTAKCNYALNETPCGSICCASGQYCQTSGQCAAGGGGSSAYYSSWYSSYSAPLRPTSSGKTTVTSTSSPTTTVPYQTPVATGSNSTAGVTSSTNHGLSGGAIAGIVIGVLAGILLLLLLLALCCAKAGIDGLLAIFGLGKHKRREETVIEERYSHHSGGGTGYYGTGSRPPPPSSRPPPPRKSGGLGGAGAVAAGLAGLALILGLKRKHDRKVEEEKTEYTGSSYYTSDYSTSASK
ncbi:MAG: hypothetical protein M1819_000094 [Sarea resinae]|nr:MAG: hypothetical protein M1819_000094 [Sarea resinae]